ncbi:MAG: hypothetical protein HC788_11685, partial [Sphingopyxis sp.]|nr:hypothetical protein [Sphingopyxis sp.]
MRSLIKYVAVASATSLLCSAAWADAEIRLMMAGEAYDGPPAFELRMEGRLVGSGFVTSALDTRTGGRLYFNAQPQNYVREFVFKIPEATFDPKAELTVSLVNDRYSKEGRGHDRNLFIQSISVNGQMLRSGDIELRASGTNRDFEYLAGFVPVYEQGEVAAAMLADVGCRHVTSVTPSAVSSSARPRDGQQEGRCHPGAPHDTDHVL